jgi:hypothetical protein
MIMRLGLALLTLPLSITGAAYLTSDADVAALAAAGTLLAGLTSPWYFIGLGRAGSVITLDTLPRLAFAGLGLTATVALADIRWFLWSQLVGVIVAVLWTTLRSVRIRDLYRVRWAEIRTAYLEQASAFGVSLTTALYGTAIVPMVAFVDPSLAGAFAILLRLQKFVLALLRPVTQVLQSWVPSGSSEAFQQRAKTGMFLGLGSGLLATTILIFFHAELIGLLSGGTLTEPVWTIAVMAATIPPIMLTQVTGLVVLVSRGLGGTVFKSTLVCAIVCLAAIIPSAWVLGLVGVWISILAGEILVVVWHLRAIRNRWSSWRLTPRLEV